MLLHRGCLVIPLPAEIDDRQLERVCEEAVEAVSRKRVRGVIVDASAVRIMDLFAARTICDMAKTASLLGAETALAGIGPGVAASLIDLDFEPYGLSLVRSVEEGLELLASPGGPRMAGQEPGRRVRKGTDV